jgi:hypothetical protein
MPLTVNLPPKVCRMTHLTDAAWIAPTNSAHRFFKVCVEVPWKNSDIRFSGETPMPNRCECRMEG